MFEVAQIAASCVEPGKRALIDSIFKWASQILKNVYVHGYKLKKISC